MPLVIQVNDIQMNNGWTDPSGSKFYLDQLEGWDSPPLRLSSFALPSQHGDITTENLYGARLLTIGGICKATSEANFYASMYYMMGQWNALRIPIPFYVTEGLTRYCNVVRNGPVRTSYVGVGTFRWNATFRADYPFKLGTTLHTVTGGPVTTLGSVASWLQITTTASGIPTITINSKVWSANATIPSGTVIDMKAMTVKNGGTSYFDRVNLNSEWLTFDAGIANTVASSLGISIAYRDAWV